MSAPLPSSELRARAEQVAAGSARSAWAVYHQDERRYSDADIADTLERARAFLAAALSLPVDASSTSDRRSFLAAGLAALCDGVHMEMRRIEDCATAPRDNARIDKLKDALLKLLTATPEGLPRGFCFLARSVLRQSDPTVRRRKLAHLRHAQACLFVFGTVGHDAPTDRI
jgi:hypothetical protein